MTAASRSALPVHPRTLRPARKTAAAESPETASESAAEEKRPNYAAPAVEKALDIIELLADEAVPLTQAQMSRALNRQPGELFRMLTCLESRGYLRRDGGSGGYALTLKLFELSRTHSPYEELLQVAIPFMRHFAQETRETCHLSVLHDGKVLVLAQEESPTPFRLSVEVGSLHSVSRTTSGRVLLAHMNEAERDALLAREPEHRKRGAKEKQALAAHLQQIRERGHERSEGEWFSGGLDIGVLIGSASSSIKAALVMATLRLARPEGDEADVLPALKRCAKDIAMTAGLIRKEAPP